jgi:hypothetical protein
LPLVLNKKINVSQSVLSSRAESARLAWQSLVAAICLAFPVWVTSRSGLRVKRAIQGLTTLRQKIANAFAFKGEDKGNELLGNGLNVLRCEALNFNEVVEEPKIDIRACLKGVFSLDSVHDRRRRCFQLSRAKRAFSLPTDAKCRRCLDKHLNSMTTPWVSETGDLGSFRQYCFDWIIAMGGSAGHIQGKPALSIRSCYESSRKEGGGLAEIRRIVDAYLLQEVTYEQAILENGSEIPFCGLFRTFQRFTSEGLSTIQLLGGKCQRSVCMFGYSKAYAEDYSLTLDGWERERELQFAVAACMQVVNVDWAPLPVTRVVIKERGSKGRIVTKAPAAHQFLGSLWNSVLLQLLARDPILGVSLRQEHEVERLVEESKRADVLVRAYRKGITGLTWRSADLTAASDNLPHDLLKAGLDGILTSLGVPLDTLSARTATVFVLPLTMEGRLTCRGTPMGSPLAWPMLSLYNGWLHSRAWEGGRAADRCLLFSCAAVIGDDYAAILPQVVNERYTSILLRTGGTPSYGKDYASLDSVMLGEELVLMDKDKTLSVAKTHTIRTFVGSDEWSRTHGPYWLNGPVALAAQAKELVGKDLANFLRVTKLMCAKHIKLFESYRIPAFLPREWGGGGFPSATANRYMRKHYPSWCRALRILTCQVKQGVRSVLYKDEMVSSWTTSSDPLAGDLRQRARVAISNLVGEYGWVRDGKDASTTYVEDAITQASSCYSIPSMLAFGATAKAEFPSMNVVGKRLRDVVKRLNETVPKHRLTGPTFAILAGLVNAQIWLKDNLQLRTPIPLGSI